MTRLPTVPSRTMIAFLNYLGFEKSRQHGSHIFFRHSDGRTTNVPDHKGEDLGREITNKILYDVDVSRKEFIDWLGKKVDEISILKFYERGLLMQLFNEIIMRKTLGTMPFIELGLRRKSAPELPGWAKLWLKGVLKLLSIQRTFLLQP